MRRAIIRAGLSLPLAAPLAPSAHAASAYGFGQSDYPAVRLFVGGAEIKPGGAALPVECPDGTTNCFAGTGGGGSGLTAATGSPSTTSAVPVQDAASGGPLMLHADVGTPITSATMPNGGAGIDGWLSDLATELAAGLKTTGSLTGNLPDTSAGNLAGIGTVADTAYAGTGSASVVAALKGLYAKLAGGISSSLTGNLPDTSAGNLAGIGTVADTAYAGTGSASVVAALKGLYAKLAGTLTTATPASATGGWSTYSAQGGTSAALLVATPVLVKAGAGTLGDLDLTNSSGATAYLQVFDAATAGAVALGTTAPKLVYWIPPGSPFGGLNKPLGPVGILFSSGIVLAATTTPTGNTAPSPGVAANVSFK